MVPDASSTSELVYGLLEDDKISRKTAELLKNFDEKAAEAGNRAEKLKDNMASGNMSMFQKKQEQNVQES